MFCLLLEEQQPKVFLLLHIVPRSFFIQQLLPFKCLLFGQDTTKSMMNKVMWKPPMSIFKYNLPFIFLTLPSYHQPTSIPSPSNYLHR